MSVVHDHIALSPEQKREQGSSHPSKGIGNLRSSTPRSSLTMVRIRRPFPRRDNNVAVATSYGTQASQLMRSAKDTSSDSPSKMQLAKTENENAPTDSSDLPPLDGTTSTTTSGTLPLPELATASKNSCAPDHPTISSPSTNLVTASSTDRNKITKRRRAVPVKGTKAERLRESLKYFRERRITTRPASSLQSLGRYQGCSSSYVPANRSITVALPSESEDDMEDK